MRSLRSSPRGASAALLCRAACAVLVLSAAACGDGGTGSGNPTPTVTHLDPVKVLQYSDSARVTVTGSSFVQGAVVRLNGTPRLTTYVSPTQLTAVVPADLMQQAGSVQVSVFNPEPRGGASGDLALPVEHRVPDVLFMEPAGVEQGSTAFILNVRGAGFAQGSVVRWNGADRPTTFVDPSRVTAQIPATDVAQVGTAQVTVFNPAPGGGTSVARTFTVAARPNPVAVVTAITPNVTVVGTGGTFTVTGTGFMAGSQVRIGGFAPTTTFISATELQFSLQPNNLPNGGFAQVLVFNPPPGGGPSNSVQLRVDNPAPTLTAVAPAQALTGQDSLVVRLTGTGFVGSSSVTLDGLPRTIVRFINSTELVTVLASYEIMVPRTFSVRVANPQPGGGTSGALTLTLQSPAPVVSSISPAQASAGQDSLVVRVTGTGFLANTVARFEGSQRTTTWVSATALDVELGPEDLDEPGTFAITVFTPAPGGGTSAAVNLTLTVPTPVLTGIPSYGASAGRPGFPLLVHGSGFVKSSVVRWNGVPRETRFVSGTRLEISVTEADVAAPGTAAISVQTPGGGTTGAVQLTIRSPGAVAVSDLQVLELPAADLVYDAARDRIYASVTAGTYANTVVRINPNTGAVDGSVGVGSGPGKLALSSDGATLWVGVKGANQVRRVALPEFTASTAFSTVIAPGELHAMPGHPGTVVVVRGGGAITVYDDGVARPHEGGSPTVTFGESAAVMYGFDNYSSEQGLRTFRVDAQGVTETRVGLGLIGGGYTRILFSAGRVYGSSGDVVDAARGVRIGQFEAGINPSAWAVDTRLGRAFFMQSDEGTLTVFDVNTFQELGSAYVAGMNSNHPGAYTERLVQWGTSGLALNDGERIYIFRSPVAGP